MPFCIKNSIHSMPVFVCCAGIVMCAQSALSMYTKSVLSSIEKQFGISSSLSGFIVASFNIGNLAFILFVSKLSSTRHRPRIMALGSLLTAFGGFINFTPHLVISTNIPRNSSLPSSWDLNSGVIYASTNLYFVLILGELLQGIGATVLIPLSSSYIDDFSTKSNCPVYLGVLFILQNIGPGIGYLLGSWTSTLYVVFDKMSPDAVLIISDKREIWLGAWWLGYLIIGGWLGFASILLFFFPKTMERVIGPQRLNTNVKVNKNTMPLKKIESKDSELASSESNRDSFPECCEVLTCDRNPLKNKRENIATPDPCIVTKTIETETFCNDFMLTLKRLATNLLYLSVVFGYTALMFVVGSLTTFMPKFLGVVFQITSSSASLYFGLAVPPTMCIGLLGGGILMKVFDWSRSKVIKMIIGSGCLSLCLITSTIFISCTDVNKSIKERNCAENKTLEMNASLNRNNSVNDEMCKYPGCSGLFIAFMCIFSLAAMIASVSVTPLYTMILRSVEPKDKCTAIGGMFLFIRAFGLMPASPLTGAVFDQTCSKWLIENGIRKNCLSYNVDMLRVRFLTVLTLGITASTFFNFIAYLIILRKQKKKVKAVEL